MAKKAEDNVASQEQNDNLEHSVEGRTTRNDPADLGVPMLPGSPDEPVGPEDALGEGPKRGDYSQRIGDSNYQPHEVRPASDEDIADPDKPSVVVDAQAPRASEQGEVEGKKGGVETA